MGRMRIGIDARKIADTGIGRYIWNLVRALMDAERENSYVLFMAPEHMGKFPLPKERVHTEPVTAGKYSLREHWALGALARRTGVELFHEPHFTLPLYTPCAKVVTIHDVIHLLDPDVGPLQKAYARWMIGSALKRADQVITVSNHSKENLVSLFGASPDKITVTHNAVDPDLGPPPREEMEAELAQLGLAPGYYLFVGSDRPHKNIKTVAGVMALLREDARFVIAGRVGPTARAMFAPFGARVRFLDHVGTRTISALYAGAVAFYFPSYMEGFGLPPLEAMACRTPVVCSNRSSIPEVVGDAAEMVDPDDAQGAANALRRLADDSAFRAGLVEKGIRQVARFSWKACALRTLEVYGKAI